MSHEQCSGTQQPASPGGLVAVKQYGVLQPSSNPDIQGDGALSILWEKDSPSSQETVADGKRGGGPTELEQLAQPFCQVIKGRGILSGSEQDVLPLCLAK